MANPFDFHLNMRENLNKARTVGHILVLDIGSSKISSAIVEFGHAAESSGLRSGMFTPQLGCRVNGFYYSKSHGVEHGDIVDTDKAVSAIRETVNQTFRAAGKRCPEVVLSYSGAVYSSQIYHGSVELDSQKVSEYHIAKAIQNCGVESLIDGHEFLHAHPVNFSIDQRQGMHDPRGMTGNRLSVDVHAVTISSRAVENVYECVTRCGLKLAGIHSAAYASGLSTLVENEQELGTAIVNIGHGITTVAGFIKKHMLFTDSFPIGGRHISDDIIQAFAVSEVQAEKLKILYGGVAATSRDDRVFCQTSHKNTRNPAITKSHLIGVIYPRVEEILENLNIVLQSFDWGISGSQQIVFTGGCSLLTGFDDLIRTKFGQGIRIGRPVQITGFPSVTIESPFSALVGLCLLVAQPQDEVWDFQQYGKGYPQTFLERMADFLTWMQKGW